MAQDTWLFTRTIKENISYGTEGVSGQEIIWAARQALAHDFIMALPEGYETRLTDHGKELSEGQRQLLTVARVIAANPPVLLLDQATALLDTRTEKLVQQSIRNLIRERTILTIAHRLETCAVIHLFQIWILR